MPLLLRPQTFPFQKFHDRIERPPALPLDALAHDTVLNGSVSEHTPQSECRAVNRDLALCGSSINAILYSNIQ